MNFIRETFNEEINFFEFSLFDKIINNIDYTLSTNQLRSSIYFQLAKNGWSKEVLIDSSSKMTINSLKNKIAVNIQFGNIARIHSDFLKLQFAYDKKVIKKAIFIVFTKQLTKKKYPGGGNLATFERAKSDMLLFTNLIQIPVLLYGLND